MIFFNQICARSTGLHGIGSDILLFVHGVAQVLISAWILVINSEVEIIKLIDRRNCHKLFKLQHQVS